VEKRENMKIHLLGPCGSGTSTLGRLIARKYGYTWFDSDDFYWYKTDPPYTKKREMDDRVNLLHSTLGKHDSWVLSGSVLNWGNELRNVFDIVVYLYVEQEERIRRLEKRERENYGTRIDSGNDMGEIHKALIDYSKQYETGGMDIRSRMSELEWLKEAKGEIIRLEGSLTIEEKMEIVAKEIDKGNHRATA